VTCVHKEEGGLSDLSALAMRYPAPVHRYVLTDLSSGDSRVCRVLTALFAALGLTHTITFSATSHHGGSHRPPTYLLQICIPRPFVTVQKGYRTIFFPHFTSLSVREISCTIEGLVYRNRNRLSSHINLLNTNTFFTLQYTTQPEHQKVTVRRFCRIRYDLAQFCRIRYDLAQFNFRKLLEGCISEITV
jgi:hypothetical protein